MVAQFQCLFVCMTFNLFHLTFSYVKDTQIRAEPPRFIKRIKHGYDELNTETSYYYLNSIERNRHQTWSEVKNEYRTIPRVLIESEKLTVDDIMLSDIFVRSNFQKPPRKPTDSPFSSAPSLGPSIEHSTNPTINPSNKLSLNPTLQPSFTQSTSPSLMSSEEPSLGPSFTPSGRPSMYPSFIPSNMPNEIPSQLPSIVKSSIPISSL